MYSGPCGCPLEQSVQSKQGFVVQVCNWQAGDSFDKILRFSARDPRSSTVIQFRLVCASSSIFGWCCRIVCDFLSLKTWPPSGYNMRILNYFLSPLSAAEIIVERWKKKKKP